MGKPDGKRVLGRPGVDGKKILREMGVWNGSSRLRIGTGGGYL